MPVTRVCFVCLGNICRSPLAEGVFKHQVQQAGLAHQFHIESFGVGPWHVGESPDPRAQAVARAHGLRLDSVAQQFKRHDFDNFDLIVAMDREVADALRRLAPTPADRDKVRLMREMDPDLAGRGRGSDLDVPDPYYGGPQGFESAYAMIERSSRRLLESLREHKAA